MESVEFRGKNGGGKKRTAGRESGGQGGKVREMRKELRRTQRTQSRR